jgi:hypothetical protein
VGAVRKLAPNISGNGGTTTPLTSQLQAIRLADGHQQVLTWAAQSLGKPKQACASLETTARPQPGPDVMSPSICVTLTWDRYWRWNTSTLHMPKTDYEGSQCTVVRTTKCFVWVVVDDTKS